MDGNNSALVETAITNFVRIYRGQAETIRTFRGTVDRTTEILEELDQGENRAITETVEIAAVSVDLERELRALADSLRAQRSAMAKARRGTGEPIEDEG